MEKAIDTLTGLPFGTELNNEMEALIEKGDEFALILLDIDELYATNRDYGMDAGDAVFRLIAKSIKSVFPEPCAAFRDARDLFDILMPGCNKEEAFLKAEQVRKLICGEKLEFTSKDGDPIRQSVSLGVSSYPDDGSRSADIFRRADSALVRAKKTGRNRVCLSREEKLMPKTSHYTQAQLEKLSFISDKTNVGEAGLLREALDDLLKKYDVDIR